MSRSRSSSSSSRSKSKNNRNQQSSHKEQKRQRSESNHKNDQQNNCLYIGNLDKKCSEEQFKKIFAQFGEFEYCYIVFEPTSHYERNRDTKLSRGYGFVKYHKVADAVKAQQALNGKQILSRKINVEFSKRAKPRQSTPGRYLGRRRSPPRRDVRYRRRSYSRESSGQRHRRRRHQKERKHRDRDRQRGDRDREHKRRQRSRSGEKKHRRRDSRQRSPRKRD